MASKRRRHRANRLALEEAGGGGPLEAYSQAWADYLARLVPYQPPPSTAKKAWPRRSSRECLQPVKAVYRWYGEEPPEDRFAEYYAFTQLVWRRSQVIGVACADDAVDYWRRQMVITFQPRGDLLGQYASNVLPPSSFDDLGEDETEAKTEEEEEELAIVTEEVEMAGN
ncbi:CRISP protein [Tyrophagus putrescentiae]|nr:CRISP protein [Tyrophagus putrescentiae]